MAFIRQNKVVMVVLSTILALSVLFYPLQSGANISDQEIAESYLKADYAATAKLLEKRIEQLRKNNASGEKISFTQLHQNKLMLAHIYAWKLNQLDTALPEYQKLAEIRASAQELAKYPPIELIFIAEIYKNKHDFIKAKECYEHFIEKSIALDKQEGDDFGIMITDGLMTFVKYQIDDINFRNNPDKKDKQQLKKMKLSVMSSPLLAQFMVMYLLSPPDMYSHDYGKSDFANSIQHGPDNIYSMIHNYGLVVNSAASSVNEASEKAMNAYLAKFPDSYYSLSLQCLFYKFYKSTEQNKKADQLLAQLHSIASKRGIELIIDPDIRFSSPEQTWKTYRTALAKDDMETVKECYVPGERKHLQVLNVLGKDKTREIGKEMDDIRRVAGSDNSAKYIIRRKQNGAWIAYEIRFQNVDGEWKMFAF
jgi:tetratricopeptide (TPR) repeat protein